MTINRFCASGLQALALATQSVSSGTTDIAIAGGMESMSFVPMIGWHFEPDPSLYTLLVENLSVNRLDRVVDALAFAVGDRDGNVAFRAGRGAESLARPSLRCRCGCPCFDQSPDVTPPSSNMPVSGVFLRRLGMNG